MVCWITGAVTSEVSLKASTPTKCSWEGGGWSMHTLGKGRILFSSGMEWEGERLHPATQIGAQFEIPFPENHTLECYA